MKGFCYVLVAVVALYVLHTVYEMSRSSHAPESTVQERYGSAAENAVRQYQKVLQDKHSTKVDVCVQAGLVSSAYLQSQDEMNYKKWKAIQKSDCARAGVPQ
jgi:hypothetical protein